MINAIEKYEFKARSDKRIQEIEIEKYKGLISDCEKQINDLKAKELTEENLQRMFIEAKKLHDAKQLNVEKMITQLFENEALSTKTIEWP